MKPTLRTLAATLVLAASPSLLSAQLPAAQPAPAQPMSFFVTSAGKGDGANYGGLAGADAYCDQLARAVGSQKTFHAYLSTLPANGQPGVNARDRIGTGPWYNSKGVLIAWNVADLHGDIEVDRNNINKANAITEKGQPVIGFGEQGNQHDILTGSDSHGRALMGAPANTTCNNWTSNGAGSAMIGHTDRNGPFAGTPSWNAAHMTVGCSQQNLVTTGGAGMLYCFAIN
jgi:hypothetical protein